MPHHTLLLLCGLHYQLYHTIAKSDRQEKVSDTKDNIYPKLEVLTVTVEALYMSYAANNPTTAIAGIGTMKKTKKVALGTRNICEPKKLPYFPSSYASV
jgi:hypothetical protein